MRKYTASVTTFLLLSVMACAQLGLVTPQNHTQRLAYAYTMVTAVRDQAKVSLENKRISVVDAQQVLRLSDLARVSLDQARVMMEKGDQANGLQTLQVAEQILLQLQSYIKSKEARMKGNGAWAQAPRLQLS